MTNTADHTETTVETVDSGGHDDVMSDSALADIDGADWSSEGGATLEGPATNDDTD